jgi:hypothetical protein
MTDRDKHNLDFLIHANEEEFDAWISKASDNDIEYALTLIRNRKALIIQEELELTDQVQNCEYARVLLTKYQLKGN